MKTRNQKRSGEDTVAEAQQSISSVCGLDTFVSEISADKRSTMGNEDITSKFLEYMRRRDQEYAKELESLIRTMNETVLISSSTRRERTSDIGTILSTREDGERERRLLPVFDGIRVADFGKWATEVEI